MAYTSCAGNIAANIAVDCEKPIVGGYTGRAVLIPLDTTTLNVVQEAENPRLITTLAIGENDKVVVIDNVFAEPFVGSTTAGNADTGRPMYTKTLVVRIPRRGGQASKDIIEPLFNSAGGFVLVAEKKDRNNDGYLEVIGYQQAMRGDIATLTRDESANGGDWSATLTCQEAWAELTLVGEDKTYASAKTAFEALLLKAY